MTLKRLSYQWLSPDSSNRYTKPTIQLTVYYNPDADDPAHIAWQLQAGMHALVQSMKEEIHGHGDSPES